MSDPQTITEALGGMKVSPSTVSELNEKIYEKIGEWRNAPTEGGHACVCHAHTHPHGES